MRFKVGDKVKILPSALDVAVWKEEVGKIGRAISIFPQGNGSQRLYVKMLNPCVGKLRQWSMSNRHVVLIPKVGRQLMFSFMSDVDGTQEESE